MKQILFLSVLFSSFLSSKKNKNQIINGHFLEDLEEDDIYIGQSEADVINLLGKPWKVPGQDNTLYYFKSERQIYALLPIKGKNKKGSIIIIELDKNKNIKNIIKKEYKEYKHTSKIKELQKELQLEKKNLQQKRKNLYKKHEKKHKERIKKRKENEKKNKKINKLF